MNARKKIIDLFIERKELSIKTICDEFDISKQRVHILIKEFQEAHLITKFGSAPNTIYRWVEKQVQSEANEISEFETKFLTDNFLVINETGEYLEGIEGFSFWCKKRKLPIQKTITEFIETKKRYQKYQNELGIISGYEKLINTKGYEKIYLDDLLYLDFYAIERFGKTPLGTILHFAKQGQNKMLMKILINEINEKVKLLIEQEKFDVIGIVPPTIKREVQLMKFIQMNLKIKLPIIDIQKINNVISIPQKSLSKLEERITNADNTFLINSNLEYKKLLLIDDAVGSGATLNQIAKKIKHNNIAKKIVGLAIVGSFKGFDIITDV